MRASFVLAVVSLLAVSCAEAGDAEERSAASTQTTVVAESTTTEMPATSEPTSTTTAAAEPSCEVFEDVATLNQAFDVTTADADTIATYVDESVRLRQALVRDLPSRLTTNAQGALGNAEFFAELAEQLNYDMDTAKVLVEGAVESGREVNSFELALVSFADSQCDLELRPLRSNLWP